jgi:pilus assembly protein Flp/PilA
VGYFEKPLATGLPSHDVQKSTKGARPMKNILMRLWQDEEGQDLTEYALLLVLIALAAIASMNTLASAVQTVFSTAASNLSAS